MLGQVSRRDFNGMGRALAVGSSIGDKGSAADLWKGLGGTGGGGASATSMSGGGPRADCARATNGGLRRRSLEGGACPEDPVEAAVAHRHAGGGAWIAKTPAVADAAVRLQKRTNAVEASVSKVARTVPQLPPKTAPTHAHSKPSLASSVKQSETQSALIAPGLEEFAKKWEAAAAAAWQESVRAAYAAAVMVLHDGNELEAMGRVEKTPYLTCRLGVEEERARRQEWRKYKEWRAAGGDAIEMRLQEAWESRSKRRRTN